MSFGLNLRGRPVVRNNSIMLGAAAFLQSVDRPQTPVCSGRRRDLAAYRAAAYGSSTRISTFDAPADRAALRLVSTTAMAVRISSGAISGSPAFSAVSGAALAVIEGAHLGGRVLMALIIQWIARRGMLRPASVWSQRCGTAATLSPPGCKPIGSVF